VHRAEDPSLNNRIDMPVRTPLAGHVAGTQDPPIRIGYSGSSPYRGI
jgi:hypothetical protein